MVWLYLLLAITAGAMLPFQYGINAQLSHWLSSPVRAAFVSFLVGTLVLLVLSALVRKPLPGAAKLGAVPWWVWIGGLLGAYYVTGSIFTAPKLGAVTLTAAVVFGQAVASALIDQFGWVGFKEHHLSPGRVAGIALVGVGIALVRLF
jgi:bacterial/archaeal transporter family-2 protein